MQPCPLSLEEYGEHTITSKTWENSDVAILTVCLINVGIQGCNFEQPLTAVAAWLELNANFIRHDSLLVIIVISDEDDCSIKSNDFHRFYIIVRQLKHTCGLQSDLLFNIQEIKSRCEAVKQTASFDNSLFYLPFFFWAP